MIPMSCPNCGRQGEVPLDRLNSRLKCKKCGTMFYMDETGSIILGDPNDAKGRRRRADSGPAIDLDFGQMIRDVPKPVRIGAPIAVAALAVGYGIMALVGALGMPADVEGRTVVLGNLFVDGEVDRIRDLAAPGTADDLATWQQTMRPKLNYEGARRGKGDVVGDATTMTTDAAMAQTYLSMVVSSPAAAAAPSPGQADEDDAPKNAMTLQIFWKRHEGEWLVDGSQTLAAANKPRPRPGAPAFRGRR